MKYLSQEAIEALDATEQALAALKELTDIEREIIEEYMGGWYSREKAEKKLENLKQ